MKSITAEFKKIRLPARTLAYIRNVGPYMGDTSLFERLFNTVGDWMKEMGLFRHNTESLSVYHDDPEVVPVEKQRISVGFTVPEGTKGKDDVQIMHIPGGDYAIGSFEIDPWEYGDAWQALTEYIRREGLQPKEMMYESYKNDPTQHPEGKHLVDICIAV